MTNNGTSPNIVFHSHCSSSNNNLNRFEQFKTHVTGIVQVCQMRVFSSFRLLPKKAALAAMVEEDEIL